MWEVYIDVDYFVDNQPFFSAQRLLFSKESQSKGIAKTHLIAVWTIGVFREFYSLRG